MSGTIEDAEEGCSQNELHLNSIVEPDCELSFKPDRVSGGLTPAERGIGGTGGAKHGQRCMSVSFLTVAGRRLSEPQVVRPCRSSALVAGLWAVPTATVR